jgi:hypothetical protein
VGDKWFPFILLRGTMRVYVVDMGEIDLKSLTVYQHC